MHKALATITILAAACGGGSNSNPDAATDASTGPDAQAGASFDSAIDITGDIDGTGTLGTLPDTKTKIYYKLTLAAGDRLVFATVTNAPNMSDGSVTDTVVTLWDPTRQQIAQDDDAWPRTSTDSQLLTAVPAAGTYFVTVEDCNSHSPSGCYPATGVTDFKYTLHVKHIAKVTPEINAAAAQDGTTTHAQVIPYAIPQGGTPGQYGLYTLDGTFRSTSDIHVFSFKPPAATVDAGARPHVEFFVQPIGKTNGDGSTSNIKAWVTAADGTTILGMADQSNFRDGDNATNGPLDLSVPVTVGTQYYLFVQNAGSASLPATDSYFAIHWVGQFYFGTAEKEGATATGMNDTMQKAELLTTPANAQAGSFFADGNIATAGDIDWYEVDPPSGTKSATISCASARRGSGVVGLTATLYAADGTTVIGTLAAETATADATAMATVPTNTAKAFLKLSATSLDPTNKGTYYLCDVFYSNM